MIMALQFKLLMNTYYIMKYLIIYIIKHQRGKTVFDTIVVSPDKTTHTFDNVPKQGKYIVRIRTVSTNGAKSPVIQRTITINPEKPAKQLEPKNKIWWRFNFRK